MKQHFLTLILACMMLTLSSCGKMMMFVFGLKSPKPYTEKQILKEAKKQKISEDAIFAMDTSLNQFLSNSDTAMEVFLMYKNHSQPAQALYYNKEGELESFHITCYAYGYRSKWNHFGSFNQFPPKTAAPVDTLMSLNDQLRFLQPVNNSVVPDVSAQDYIVLVYFNRVMRARNRRLIKEVKKNADLIDGQHVKYIYVNTDNYWFYCLGDDISFN